MKKLLYILLFITLISCNSKTEKIKERVIEIQEIDLGISNEDIYTVINVHLEREINFYKEFNNKLDTNHLSFTFFIKGDDNDFNYCGIPNLIEKDTLFTDGDREFMKLQIQKTETFDLNQKYISNFKVIPKDTIFDLLSKFERKIIREKYGVINWIGLPLFSKNKDFAIISYDYVCGVLCGHSRTSIYKKENGKWIWLKDISYGIS